MLCYFSGVFSFSVAFVTILSFSSPAGFQVKSVCLSLQDSNVLVQRNLLEILLYFFPFAECLVGIQMITVTLLLFKVI